MELCLCNQICLLLSSYILLFFNSDDVWTTLRFIFFGGGRMIVHSVLMKADEGKWRIDFISNVSTSKAKVLNVT